MNNTTVQKVGTSTTSVALVNSDGSGRVVTIQSIVNQLASAETQVTNLTAQTTQITALGLTLPTAESNAPARQA